MDSLFKHFSDELFKEGANQTMVLAKFYASAFSVPLAKPIITSLAKLKKMYGADEVFNAILQAYDMPELTNAESGLYGLLTYFCKQSVFNTKTKGKTLLTDFINDNTLRVQELKKVTLDIPRPFEETDGSRR